MQNYMIGEGWQALSHISSFMQHVEKRKQLKIFGELDARLDYCEYLIRTQTNKNDTERFKSKKRKKELGEDLCRALKSLSTPQIIHYYNKLITQLVNLTNDVCQPPVIENKSFVICQAYSKTYNLKLWKKKKLRFDRENHIIYAEKDKKIKIYDLANYIIRRSDNSDYFVLILEAINDTPLEKSRTASFGFQYKNTYILWSTSILRSIQYKQWESLVVSLGKEHLLNKTKHSYHTIKKQKDWERLNKTEGNVNGSEEFPGQNIQSAVYIPLVEELSSTVEPTAKTEPYQQKSQNIQTSQFKSQKELSQDYMPLQESFTYKLTHNCEDIVSLQDFHYELQLQGAQTKKMKRQLSFASAILDDFDINKENLEDLTDFQEIADGFTSIEKKQGEAFLYEDKYCSNHYRMIYLSPTHNTEQTGVLAFLQYFLNISSYLKINKSISLCQLKATIQCQNSIIIYEQHYPYNRLHRSRDFVYLRHLTHNIIGHTFIIDRSIATSHLLPQSTFNVRGSLQNVYRVSANKNQIMFVADLQIDHKGELSESRNRNLCKKYIANLVQGLSDYFAVKPVQITSMKYLNLLSNNKHLSSSGKVQDERQQILTFSYSLYSLQSSEKQTLNVKKNPNRKRKKSSFYHIERNNLIEHHLSTQSYLLLDKNEPEVEFAQFRKTYSSPRKTYIQIPMHLAANLNPVHEQFQCNVIIQPLWKLQWKIDQENGGFIPKRAITMKEKEMLKRVIEKAAKKTLLGKDVEKISFPVDVLAAESRLERLLKNCSYAPGIFENTHNMSFLKLFKKTVVFGILSAILSLNHQKTFDSGLGETYQCQISKDCMGYAEQIGVSPAISAIYLLAKDYQISSTLRQKFKLTMSQVQWENQGVYKVKFKAGPQVCYTAPIAALSGITSKQRTFLLEGKSYFWIQSENVILALQFGPKNTFAKNESAKADYFEGTIYQVTQAFMQEFLQQKRKPFQSQLVKKLNKVVGRWTKFINFQDEIVQFADISLYELFNISNPLPSDSSNRKDIQLLRNEKLEQAEAMKLALEQQQRKDECLRHQYYPD